ncbi:MAG: insulinase family protein, partial [Deltaproteobacteria bacterium]
MTNVLRTRLPNGLRILCEGWHQAPVVAMQAWVRVGAADEEPDEAGLAHLHEHMLFKGTQRRGVGALAHAVEAGGGEINAWTSFDQTVYHLVLEKQGVELGLDVLADALQNALFDPTELQREIEVVVEEIQRAKDSPASRLSQALFGLAYQQHPYRLPILGTEQSVRSVSREHILKFYKKHYRPDNVTLIVVGDMAPEALAHKVEQAFGAWESPAGPHPRKARQSEPAYAQPRLHILREDVKETRLAIAHLGPAIGAPQLPATDLLATIVGHGESSRLFDEVRRRRGARRQQLAQALRVELR